MTETLQWAALIFCCFGGGGLLGALAMFYYLAIHGYPDDEVDPD